MLIAARDGTVVQAVQMMGRFSVGNRVYERGTWMVLDGGRRRVLTAAEFREQFRPPPSPEWGDDTALTPAGAGA